MLDAGGAPILLDPNGGPPRIARDGTIFQGNRQIGAIGLFTIDGKPPTSPASRIPASFPTGPRPRCSISPATGVQQGYIENANVNAVMEMSRLITVTRAFEMVSASLTASESSLQEAIRTLGQTG